MSSRLRHLVRAALGVLAAVLAAAVASPQDLPGSGAVLVHLADGSSLPLTPWALTYEVSAWPRGSSPAFAKISRTPTTELRFGKKAWPAAGLTVTIEYEQVERQAEEDGEVRKVPVLVAREVTLVSPDGKKTVLRKEPPHRDLLLPGAEKSLLLQPRSLDLEGQTLTGTRRAFCLLSYTTLVECNAIPGEQVVKIAFPK